MKQAEFQWEHSPTLTHEFQHDGEAFLTLGAALDLNALHCSCETVCRCGAIYE